MGKKEIYKDKSYKLLMDGVWELNDLYTFPRTFAQCYSFIYCLDSQRKPEDRERIEQAFKGYPWRGGYSYINIYRVMQFQIPFQESPKIKSISYASPGWMEIFLNVDVAIKVAKSVGILLGTSVTAAKIYREVKKTLSQIKLDREKRKLEEMKLTAEQHKVVLNMCREIAPLLGYESLADLHKYTGNPEVSLKLLSAHYRRLNVLTEYVKKGKVELPENLLK